MTIDDKKNKYSAKCLFAIQMYEHRYIPQRKAPLPHLAPIYPDTIPHPCSIILNDRFTLKLALLVHTGNSMKQLGCWYNNIALHNFLCCIRQFSSVSLRVFCFCFFKQLPLNPCLYCFLKLPGKGSQTLNHQGSSTFV